MRTNDIVAFFETSFDKGFLPHRTIGLENEYPITNILGLPIGLETYNYLWAKLREYGWEIFRDGATNQIVGATRKRQHKLLGEICDTLSTDVGYHTLEISLAPSLSIQEGETHLKGILQEVIPILANQNAVLLGYGVQPIGVPSPQSVAPKGRYRFFEADSLNTFISPEEGLDVHIFTLSAACHTHIKVSKAEAILSLNALAATAGLRIALMANSPIYQNKFSNFQAVREMFWDWCWTNRKTQIGIPPRFQNIAHYVDYIGDFRAFMVKRSDTYLKLPNHIPLRDYLSSSQPVLTETVNGETQRVNPELADFSFHCGFAWHNVRLQPAYGTVEDRSSCQQPPHEHFVANALTLGLIENLADWSQVSERLSRDQWREIRLQACLSGLSFSTPGIDLLELTGEMLTIAEKGLHQRGYGEEVYLSPLYRRLEHCKSPSVVVADHFNSGGIPAVINFTNMERLLELK